MSSVETKIRNGQMEQCQMNMVGEVKVLSFSAKFDNCQQYINIMRFFHKTKPLIQMYTVDSCQIWLKNLRIYCLSLQTEKESCFNRITCL